MLIQCVKNQKDIFEGFKSSIGSSFEAASELVTYMCLCKYAINIHHNL